MREELMVTLASEEKVRGGWVYIFQGTGGAKYFWRSAKRVLFGKDHWTIIKAEVDEGNWLRRPHFGIGPWVNEG